MNIKTKMMCWFVDLLLLVYLSKTRHAIYLKEI